jgi:hypothetical protein
MARIQDYYQNRRDLGPSAMVAYLDAWLDERAGMNKSLMASEGKQADPSRLAEQEARIRAAMADLLKAKVSGSVEQMKAADDLAKQALSSYEQVTVANVKAGSDRAVALIQSRTDLSKQDVDSRAAIAKELTLTNPDGIKIIASAYDTATTEMGGDPDRVADALVRMVTDVTKTHEGGHKAKRDAAAAEVLRQATEAGNAHVVARIEKAFFSGSAADDYFERVYPGFTPEEQAKVYEEVKKLGAGADPEKVVALYEKLTAAGKGGGGTKTSTSYSDIVPDLDAKLKSLEDAADDLAKARREAMTSPKRFPRPNYMIANPNTFTDPRQVAELRKWGVLDPTYVEEMVTARQREGTWAGALKSVGERGGASQSIEKVAPLVLTEEPGAQVTYTDAEAAWLGTLKRAGSGEPFPGKGGYTYTLNADGSITSLAPEKGKKPVKVEKGSAPHTAILEEVFPAPGLPDEVSDLYAPSIELAKAGQWAKAAEAAEKVSHDDVRSAYAQALVDVASGRSAFSGVPSEGQMEAMAASIGEGGGKWGEHFRDLLRLPVSDQYAKSRVMGAVDSLGKALHKTPDVERDLDESDIDERAYGLAELRAGRELNTGAYARGAYARGVEDATGPVKALVESSSPEVVREQLRGLPAERKGVVPDYEAGVPRVVGDALTNASPRTFSPVVYFDEPERESPLAAPDARLAAADGALGESGPGLDLHADVSEAQRVLATLDQWEKDNPLSADAPASKQDREAVAFTRKEWEKKLDSARAKARASRDYVAPEERGAALLRDRVQKEAETVAPPTVRPPIRQAPPVSAAKPPPAALDYAELFSASATPTDELDYDLDELMGRAPAGAKR